MAGTCNKYLLGKGVSLFVFVPWRFLLHLCLLFPFSFNVTSLLWWIQTTCWWQRNGNEGILGKVPFPTMSCVLSCSKSLAQSWVAEKFERREEHRLEDDLHQIGLAAPLLPRFKLFPCCLCWYYSLNTNSVFEQHAKTIIPRGKSGLMVQWSLNTFEVNEESRSESPFPLVYSAWVLSGWPYGSHPTTTLQWPIEIQASAKVYEPLQRCLEKKVIFISSTSLYLYIFLFCSLSDLLSWHPLSWLSSALG